MKRRASNKVNPETGITIGQSQVLADIQRHQLLYGFAPTVRELCEYRGCQINSVYQMLERLRDAGKVDWQDGKARTLRVL